MRKTHESVSERIHGLKDVVLCIATWDRTCHNWLICRIYQIRYSHGSAIWKRIQSVLNLVLTCDLSNVFIWFGHSRS